mgnify:CR=1 FL=1
MTPSLPAWGEWIEIVFAPVPLVPDPGLSPHGESGLKFTYPWYNITTKLSLPAWGEWIEICTGSPPRKYHLRLSPHGESGLK